MYLGNKPQYDTTINKKEYVDTVGGRTNYPVVFDDYVEVYVNGIRLAEGDFTKDAGISITLVVPTELNDEVICNGYQSATYLDADTLSYSGSVTGDTVGEAISTLNDADTALQASIESKVISKVASSVLLNKDSLALDNSVITKSNANITYTGNGTTQDIVTGISSVDFTVASNGSGYYHDRAAGDCIVKDDAGNVVDSGSCVVNTSKVHFKGRNVVRNNDIIDGIRGKSENIYTNLTNSEGNDVNSILSFNVDGVTVGSNVNINQSGAACILHQTLYTHIKWGLTSQGKRYISAYNPVTREVMTMYQGSGIAGHQIPNALGIKLDYVEVKNLDDGASPWSVLANNYNKLYVSSTNSSEDGVFNLIQPSTDDTINLGTVAHIYTNYSNNSYISYGFANSETKIITQYQGTGVAGNFVETKDVNGIAKKPRRVIVKRTDSAGNWHVFDSERQVGSGADYLILLDSNIAEVTTTDYINFTTNGFTLGTTLSVSGGSYIAIVEFDTTSSNDDTYFDLPTDDTNLTLVNGKLVFTDGRASNGGYNVSTQDFTGSIDFSGISDGIKYVGLDELGNTIAYDDVSIGLYDKTNADDNRLTFDTESGKWFTTTGGELVTNGDLVDNSTGWTLGSSVSWSDGGLTFSASNNTDTYTSVLILEDGEPYVIEIECSTSSGNFPIRLAESGNLTNNILLETITESSYIEFTSDGTYDVVDIRSNSVSGRVEKVSVYKKEATLDTPLTNPICFIDDKPYQITSETPMDRLEDYPSIPKNIMETLDVEFIKSRGNRKIIEIGTIFNNTRYVIPWNEVQLPVDETNYEDCDMKLQLQASDGVWFAVGQGPQDGSTSTYIGALCEAMAEGLVVQTAENYLSIASDDASLNTYGVGAVTLTSAPARVIVTYQGETK